MQKCLSYLLYAFCALFVFACESDPSALGDPLPYYDVRNTVEKQIDTLKKIQAGKPIRVQKKASLNGKEEVEVVEVTDWQKELSFFIDANINKNVLSGSYKKTKVAQDELYLTMDVHNKVKKISVEYPNDSLNIIKIRFADSNILYTITRDMELCLLNGVLSHYIIKGSKQMLNADPFHYEISSTLLF